MTDVILEHANVTVRDAVQTAAWMKDVFDWDIRWEGASIHGGHSKHVGGKDSYLAIYQPPAVPTSGPTSYQITGGLNHLAVVVEDLDAVEERVKAAGFVSGNHADYEPGRRFYFRDHDGIEFEVVSYA